LLNFGDRTRTGVWSLALTSIFTTHYFKFGLIINYHPSYSITAFQTPK